MPYIRSLTPAGGVERRPQTHRVNPRQALALASLSNTAESSLPSFSYQRTAQTSPATRVAHSQVSIRFDDEVISLSTLSAWQISNSTLEVRRPLLVCSTHAHTFLQNPAVPAASGARRDALFSPEEVAHYYSTNDTENQMGMMSRVSSIALAGVLVLTLSGRNHLRFCFSARTSFDLTRILPIVLLI